AKLSPTGSLVLATCLGGSEVDDASAVAIDSTGVYVAGVTGSADFPVTSGAVQSTIRTTKDSRQNGFVAKLDPAGTRLAYATFLPMEGVSAIAVDRGGAAYVTGTVTTRSGSIFTPTPGAFQPVP